jgi:hypothetical protein
MLDHRCEDWGGELIECNGECDYVAYAGVPSAQPRPVALRQQREDHQQPVIRRDFGQKLRGVYRKPVFGLARTHS